ncbi:hypothetical protein [Luteimonas sp. A478]
MKDPDFGFTNIYLKSGVILLSVGALVYLTGLVRDPSLPSAAFRGDAVRIFIVVGAISFVIGWIVKARGGRDA